MGRLLRDVRQCPECLQEFRPSHKEQLTCSGSCGARRRCRLHPNTAAMHKAWAATQAKARGNRVARLKGMTISQIWRLAYREGYTAGWQRQRRTVAA